jgi:hypothetical protein
MTKKQLNNPLIECGCGCKEKLLKYNKWDRERTMIKGHNNKGKPLSEEHKRKISKNKERRLKISLANTGKKRTEEFKIKMSLINKGKHFTEEHKKKLSLVHTGLTKQNCEYIKNMANTKKRLFREGKLVSHMKGKHKTLEQIEKNRLTKIAQWKDPNSIYNNQEYRERLVKSQIKGLIKRPTSFEKFIIDLCLKYNLPFIYTGDGRVLINFKNPDFLDEKNKLVIEVFFSYFKIRDYGSVENYKEFCRNKYESAGYKVIFLDENDIKGDELKVVEKIKEGYL